METNFCFSLRMALDCLPAEASAHKDSQIRLDSRPLACRESPREFVVAARFASTCKPLSPRMHSSCSVGWLVQFLLASGLHQSWCRRCHYRVATANGCSPIRSLGGSAENEGRFAQRRRRRPPLDRSILSENKWSHLNPIGEPNNLPQSVRHSSEPK